MLCQLLSSFICIADACERMDRAMKNLIENEELEYDEIYEEEKTLVAGVRKCTMLRNTIQILLVRAMCGITLLRGRENVWPLLFSRTSMNYDYDFGYLDLVMADLMVIEEGCRKIKRALSNLVPTEEEDDEVRDNITDCQNLTRAITLLRYRVGTALNLREEANKRTEIREREDEERCMRHFQQLGAVITTSEDV